MRRAVDPRRPLTVAAVLIAAGLLISCTTEFWDMDPPQEIRLGQGEAGAFFIEAVEVRSAFYNPPDLFSEAFIPAFRQGASTCFDGRQPMRAVVFIHELDRSGDLTGNDGRVRLPGSVDLHGPDGRMVGRYLVVAELDAGHDDLAAQRSAAAEAFGRTLCARISGDR